ncbi:5-deoxy-glucuronate isomerase [Kiloniella laminariae]|uniref:5-deoxy-glucuronate isomerase n=1 Tax=Kiloniella laminariae TaxID=454162 RepID=UPI000364C5EF|nr:5-deoxy-glucuronate isomerase [Kiloniella laminariae]
MSKLLVKPSAPDASGRVLNITPENAGWTYVGFDLHKLENNQIVTGETGEREVCLVFVSGKGQVRVDDQDFGLVGERMSPFEGKPWSVYVPAGSSWQVSGQTAVELAVCSAPGNSGKDKLPARIISPEQAGMEKRGVGTNVRHVANILPETDPAESLLVVEVITPGGHWSSYPPHKHDRDALPDESLLEETYYHRINPSQGFAFQRVYTDDRSLDETLAVEDGNVVLVPEGYHPCGAPHGYDLYYLNVMAGPKRVWKFHNDPAHEWMLK